MNRTRKLVEALSDTPQPPSFVPPGYVEQDHVARREQDAGKRLNRYTAYLVYDGEVGDEIDVDAPNPAIALQVAKAVATHSYQPGFKIKMSGTRTGYYL